MSPRGSSSSLLITCPCHLSLASLACSAMSTNPHVLLIFSFYNVSERIFFISSYYVSMPSHPCFPYFSAMLPYHISISIISLTSYCYFSRNNTLWTPLDCAAAEGWTKTATVLLNKGSPVDPLDKAKVIKGIKPNSFTCII